MMSWQTWTLDESAPVLDALLRIAVVIVAALIMRWIVGLIITLTVNHLIRSAGRRKQTASKKPGGRRVSLSFPLNSLDSERLTARTRTLGSVARSISSVLIFTTALFVILDLVGVNIAAILASAGIIAAGLAFGAQNVIRDLLNGMFMVIEDQIGLGDSVIIGDVDGVVEVVGIRITQVRSYDGTLWFIRNGEINQIGNVSHGWGRAVCDIAVDGAANTDSVRALLGEAAHTVAISPDLARAILGDPEVFGIEQMSQNSITFRIAIKTTADAQDEVIRAIRSEAKSRLDAAGIALAATDAS